MSLQRLLNTNGRSVSAVGMGTWATGGPSSSGDQPLGWGSSWSRDGAADVLRAAFDAGITVFDTSDAYGAGTAERLIGESLRTVRDQVAIVTKWGNLIDEPNRQLVGVDPSPVYIRTALEGSLARLRTDHVDMYLLHLSGLPANQAVGLLAVLQELVLEGKVGAYGWSTDDPALATTWVGQPGFGAIEFEANVVNDAPDLVTLCDDHQLPGLVRGPLGTGLLGGGHPAGSQITDPDDFRFRSPDWLNYFDNGRPVDRYARRMDAIGEVLTGNGRTLAQGALCWLLARSPHLIPIPGAQTVEQAREHAQALEHGPLTPEEVAEIRELLVLENA
jgi:aryl-alcohol dehydrogenase-like predicted oxidoreductase